MSAVLNVRPSAECRFDVVALGEVMLRFDPGHDRVRTARSFRVSEGGGEYNVARALTRVFGHRTALVTALGDGELGLLLEDLLLQGGVNLDHVVWKHTDDIGRVHRTPLNFTDRGFGARRPVGVYDRAHSAASTLAPTDVDWEHLFGGLGVRWLHTGGIFAGLSDSTLETTRAAIAAARQFGTVVSYDVNFRPSLWRAAGGGDAARQLTADLIGDVDVLFGVESIDDTLDTCESAERTPAVITQTQRRVRSASEHDWSAIAWSRSSGRIEGASYEQLQVLDRVGSGDSFASGVIHGLLDGRPLAEALDLGIAHAALTMTTIGDTSSSRLDEVEALAAGEDSSVER